jgi:[ribosomal protein S5]-alanine N-acetyltransferase
MADIITPRLRLRQPRVEDLEAIHGVLSQPLAMRYWSTPPHTDIEESRVWLSHMITQSSATGCDFLVEYEGRVIGKAGCYEPPNVGYIFHPDVWGQGFATEALAAVIQHVFEVGAFAALLADVDPRNVASLKLLGRLGFREAGRAEQTWLVGNDWCDSVYLELGRAAAPPHSLSPEGPI